MGGKRPQEAVDSKRIGLQNMTSRLDIEAHPMLNPTVLKTVFRASDFTTLKTCRLVCTLWRNAAKETWKSKTVLRVTEAPLLLNDVDVRSAPLDSLLQQGNTSKVQGKSHQFPPTRNYHFVGIKFFEEDAPGWRLFQDEWYTRNMTSLKLTACGFPNSDSVARLLSLVPNLEELRLSNNTYFIQTNPPGGRPAVELRKLKRLELCLEVRTLGEPMSLPWKEFFNHFPNLEVLSVRFHPWNYDLIRQLFQVLGQMLEAIGEIRREDSNKLKITELDLLNIEEKGVYFLPAHIIDSIIKLNLQMILTNFSVDFGYVSEPPLLKQLLEAHNNLKKLTVFNHPAISLFSNFSTLQISSVQELHLHGNLADDFGFLRWTPNLKVLHWYKDGKKVHPEKQLPFFRNWRRDLVDTPNQGCKVEWTLHKFDMKDVKLEKLEDLRGDFIVEREQSFQILANWMPNVRTLFVPVNKDTFRVVCERWANSLENWMIPKWCSLDDETITGVAINNCGKLLRSRLIPENNYVQSAPPNITHLRGLRSFSMESPGLEPLHAEECRHALANLSDHAVVHGFLKVPHLSTLIIHTPRPLLAKTMQALEAHSKKRLVVCDRLEHCPCGRNQLVRQPPGWKPLTKEAYCFLSSEVRNDANVHVFGFKRMRIDADAKHHLEARLRSGGQAHVLDNMAIGWDMNGVRVQIYIERPDDL